MNIWDILILALVAVMLVLAFRTARGRAKGNCCGSGCACGMNCRDGGCACGSCGRAGADAPEPADASRRCGKGGCR